MRFTHNRDRRLQSFKYLFGITYLLWLLALLFRHRVGVTAFYVSLAISGALRRCNLPPLKQLGLLLLLFNDAFRLRGHIANVGSKRLLLLAVCIKHVQNRAETLFNLDHLRCNHVPHLSYLFHQLQAFFLLLAHIIVDALLHCLLRFGEPGQSVWVLPHHALET